MFPTTTVPFDYGYVEKIKSDYYYEDILKEIIKKSNRNNNVDNNNIIGDNYIMNAKSYIKSFSELFDSRNGKNIQLLKRIDFNISSDEDGFYYTNRQYNIFVFGESQLDAENNIFDELMFQYNRYVFEKDEDLEKKKKRLKYDLLSLINTSDKI